MNSIIITGEQVSGKTTLSRIIATGYGNNAYFCDDIGNFVEDEDGCRNKLTIYTSLIVFDELFSERDLIWFKQLVSCVDIRLKYSNTRITPTIIGVFQEHLPEFDEARHSLVFHLKSRP